MRPTIAQLKTWDIGTLVSAATETLFTADTLDYWMDDAVRTMNKVGSWTGRTHDAADAKIKQESDHVNELRSVFAQIGDELQEAATDLEYAKDFVLREANSAIAGGFKLTGNVEVSHPEKTDEALTIQVRINSGLDTIARLDETYGAKLEGLVSDLASMIDGQPDIDVPGIGQIDPDALVKRLGSMTPDERAALLSEMTPEQVRRLAQADPQAVGNMDGVPFPVRIDANEVNIRAALADEEQKYPRNEGRINQLKAMLEPIEDPLSGPNGADNGMVERTFLAFENTPHGNMIEIVGAIGPNTRNVAVYVPGTNSTLDGSQSNHNAAWNLANRSGGPVILYMDGEFPHGGSVSAFVDPFSDNDAMDTTMAKRMAPDLVAFGHELDRTLDTTAPQAKTTFLGHSYGGSIVGTAEQMGLNADRVIYASSAGIGTLDDQPWSNPNPDVERYSMTAPGDPIQYFQGMATQHGGDPDTAPGVTRMDTGYFGADNKDFPGKLVWGSDGHGKYWDDPKSDAFQNMVKVIKGEEPTPYVWRAPDSRLENTDPPPMILAPGPMPNDLLIPGGR
ncbi:alpha/beta hydrolase [Gordonia sp. ABSL1-1]|uniref:alpha/beta hydrolase n=1 Tax=Gordonia sp. ABSL1-1 TaxID=3053923 RepID=UPI002572DC07|nr:alpha/beta hydrolase [Gordonia sp. ABSL1-1]MDL9936029.1 alpha/beta hydrolase [Gordonia sp. ABSL1-1]